MKKIIILFVFFTYYSYSQQNGLLYYGYIESLPNGAAKGSDYNAYLIFNKEMSNYITAKKNIKKTDKIYEEKITKIYPTILNETREMQAEVKTKDLMPGLFGNGTIKAE